MPESSTTAPSTGTEGVHLSADGPRHRMLETDRCTRWLGAEVLLAEEGHAKLRMTVRPEMTNGFEIVHGGMVFTLADTCFAMACNHPQADEGTITVASGADISFLKAANLGDTLTAEAWRVAQTGRSGIYDVVVTSGEDTIAVFRGRSRTVPSSSKGHRL